MYGKKEISIQALHGAIRCSEISFLLAQDTPCVRNILLKNKIYWAFHILLRDYKHLL
jgi:hypothetical protein